jgi:hypothetical protein
MEAACHCGTVRFRVKLTDGFNPNQYGVNAACLKGVSPFDFADVPVIDGINHPSDQGRGYEIVGHLRVVRVEDRPIPAAAWPSV